MLVSKVPTALFTLTQSFLVPSRTTARRRILAVLRCSRKHGFPIEIDTFVTRIHRARHPRSSERLRYRQTRRKSDIGSPRAFGTAAFVCQRRIVRSVALVLCPLRASASRARMLANAHLEPLFCKRLGQSRRLLHSWETLCSVDVERVGIDRLAVMHRMPDGLEQAQLESIASLDTDA